MFGWRARLGVIVPSSNTTVEGEFEQTISDGASLHAARMPLESVTVEELDSMADDAVSCADRLSHANVDVVAYACTTGSLLHGKGFDSDLEASLSETAGVPAVATALSVKRALRALGAERIVVVTPYTDELNDREESYLDETGFDVVELDGRGIEANTGIGSLRPEDAYRQVRAVVSALDVDSDSATDSESVAESVDAVFVSCTNYRTFPAIEPLESDLGIPVVTSNQATLWDALRAAEVADEIPGQLGDHDRA
ncbi:maleate cis-trans isomerase family protein [Haladaptatus caseinilyticus]|uniref:maleate cis-trans isomerase family protein n=1 Tax=Haladaptatus caseinilyticus TaxID=2993314 RepID=UPI00224AEC91|nr:aspartate/glutamate racemase family protein [Haladaptatus caseinilyticus]